MYRKRNIQLLLILGALIVLSIILLNRGDMKTRLTVDETYFSIADTASIDKIEIRSPKFENILTRTGKQWEINGKYKLDPSMKTVLLTVLNKVKAQRPVPVVKTEEVKKELMDNGIHVDVYSDNTVIQSYVSGGNGISVSYFMKNNEEPYIVHLPGYDSYVSGIFEVSENDWRDRFIFSTNWIGLKELALEYPGNVRDNFKIVTAGTHFAVPGISQPDTAAIMEYIEFFSYFQVDQLLGIGSNLQYDSIFSTTPYALLKIDDTSFEKPFIIKFFVLDTDNALMPCLVGDQPALMSSDRIKPIFKKRDYFVMN